MEKRIPSLKDTFMSKKEETDMNEDNFDEKEYSDNIDFDEEDILRNYRENKKKSKEMVQYEQETGKYAIWRGVITEGFKKWLKGEKVYDRDKERISLYVSEDTKNKWLEFINKSNYTTISKLIRESVKAFIEADKALKESSEIFAIGSQKIPNISHALKQPLTSIKGYSQLLLENYTDELDNDVLTTVRNIFEQSILLENKIISFLDNIKMSNKSYDLLLVEDDLATVRLLSSYFESKGISMKGVVSGSKAIEELKHNRPKVVLLDIILPDLSGYDICRTIKSDNEYKSIPIYFLTAIAGSEVEKNLAETGADGYILKPFNFSDFNSILEILEQDKA